MTSRTFAYYTASVSLIFLILMNVMWLATYRPDSIWIVIKILLLLLPLFGILRRNIYTYQWSSLFIFVFFADAVMRAWVDLGYASLLAGAEVMACVCFFVALLAFIRTFPKHPKKT
ncbi:MAG: DUF2069 domain-containing protein [Neisseriaceae bacterium]|nr:DUF2069 domain-containing protein [Neisseriaceae bacterium]